MMRQPVVRLASAMARPQITTTLTTSRITARTFTSLPSLRPTAFPTTAAFVRPSLFTPTTTTTTTTTALDLVPQSAISAHPAFMAAQVRCGPRNNMQRNTRLKRKRKIGFVTRNKTKAGRKILMRRKEKRRCRVSN